MRRDAPVAPNFGRRTAPAPERPLPPAARHDGRHASIVASAALSPLAQVDRLVALMAASGDAAPAFAAALIGELVLTRMRLAAVDPSTLWSLET